MGDRTEAVPLPFGWLLVTKSYLQSVFENGRETGVIETDNIINNGRALAESLEDTLKMNESLREKLRSATKLVDQTQKDAYDLGYLHGLQGQEKER